MNRRARPRLPEKELDRLRLRDIHELPRRRIAEEGREERREAFEQRVVRRGHRVENVRPVDRRITRRVSAIRRIPAAHIVGGRHVLDTRPEDVAVRDRGGQECPPAVGG